MLRYVLVLTNHGALVVLPLDDDPEYKKSGIPQPLHKVLMSKFGGASGSGSGDFEFEESSTSGDDISQTSGSGNEGSGSQKKDDIKATVAESGSGETPSSVPSPTVGGASNEIGSGSASLAEGKLERQLGILFCKG